MDVSERITFLRKVRLLSQNRLAEMCNLTEMSIQNYESGRRKPSYDALISLADAFNVSLDYLVGRTDNPEINR